MAKLMVIIGITGNQGGSIVNVYLNEAGWRYMPHLWPGKKADGSFVMRTTTDPDAVVPQLDVRNDTGYYVRALAQLPPGGHAMAAGEWCSWSDWMKGWARGMGIDELKARYEQISIEKMGEGMGDFGKEMAEMFEWATMLATLGYDGRIPMMTGQDLRKVGFEIPLTTVEEYTKREDWSAALNL